MDLAFRKVNLEELARELGAMEPWETVEKP